MAALRKNQAYSHLDFHRELGKMDAWLLTPKGRRRTKTRKFIVSWLNKAADEQRPMATGPAPSTAGHCQDRQSNGRHSKPCTNPCVLGEASVLTISLSGNGSRHTSQAGRPHDHDDH